MAARCTKWSIFPRSSALDPLLVEAQERPAQVADDGDDPFRRGLAGGGAPAVDQVIEAAGRALAHEDVDLAVAVPEQAFHEVAPDEAGCAGYEVGHGVARIAQSPGTRRQAAHALGVDNTVRSVYSGLVMCRWPGRRACLEHIGLVCGRACGGRPSKPTGRGFSGNRDWSYSDEGVGFRVLLRGINVPGVIAPRSETDARCASMALSHLSLSLSLSSARGLEPRAPRRCFCAVLLGPP